MTQFKLRRIFLLFSAPYFLLFALIIFLNEPLLKIKNRFFPPEHIEEKSNVTEQQTNQVIWDVKYKSVPVKNDNQTVELIIKYTNEYRTQNNLPPLAVDKGLTNMAYNHSRDMGERNYFSNESPEGLSPTDRKIVLYSRLYGGISENIFRFVNAPTDQEQLAREAINGWMNEPDSRASILKKDFTHIGVGVYANDKDVYITQDFSATVAIFDDDIPLRAKKGSTFIFRGSLLKPKGTRNIDFFFQRHYRGFVKAKVQDKIPIKVEWLDDVKFVLKVRFAKKGVYELCLSVDQKFYPGQPIKIF